MSKPVSVYISSPYTIGDNFENVQVQVKCAAQLLAAGYQPFAPLVMSAFIHMQFPRTPEQWLDYDFYWLSKCSAILRLPGKSAGGDKEVEYAKKLGIPVVYSLKELEQLG